MPAQQSSGALDHANRGSEGGMSIQLIDTAISAIRPPTLNTATSRVLGRM
jgi:hypothetical protein